MLLFSFCQRLCLISLPSKQQEVKYLSAVNQQYPTDAHKVSGVVPVYTSYLGSGFVMDHVKSFEVFAVDLNTSSTPQLESTDNL